VVLCLILFAGCKGCRSTTTIAIRNGDLTHGTDAPDYWRSNPGLPGLSILRWNRPTGGPAELEISNLKPNDSHWTQDVHLEPGWYLFTASVRAEGVPRDHAGANLSSLEDGIISSTLSGTTGWKTLGFYLRVGKAGGDLPIACRLGGYSSPNTGKAWFRHITGTRVDEPTQPDIPRYDLDVIRGIGAVPPNTAGASKPPATQRQSPIAQATATIPLTPLSANQSAGKNAPQSSRRDRLIERSIDVTELSMAIFMVLATLYAGGCIVHKKLHRGDEARDKSYDRDQPSEPEDLV